MLTVRKGLLLAAIIAWSFLPASAQTLDPENTVVLKTSDNCDVTIRLRPDLAPQHVAQIKKLTRAGFYDGIIFHRVIDGFMAQTGDPTGTGTGGSSEPDLQAEFSDAHFARGTIGMARSSDPNSANSQFFIMFAEGGFLDRQYTVWGEVASGMECIDQIEKGEPPATPDKIVSMKVMKDMQ
jgi:cyclophilin family peptidyl-prolyl cis-trans isomerase